MDAQVLGAVPPQPQVKVTFSLGTETYSTNANKGILSEQLASLKEESMAILKDYITKHNVPNDVPDEPLEESSSADDESNEIPEKPRAQFKKTKLN